MNLEDADRRLRQTVSRIPAADREYLLEVLTADEASRAEAIGNLHGTGLTPATVELLIDAEAEPPLRALLVGIPHEV